MLREHPYSGLSYFAIDFDPQIDFKKRLDEAAVAIQSLVVAPHWSIGSAALFKLPENDIYYQLSNKRFFCQSIGLHPWLDTGQGTKEQILKVADIFLEKMEVTTIKRIGLRLLVWIPLKMTREEMTKLAYGTLLPQPKDLVDIAGTPTDFYLNLYGTHMGYDRTIQITTMTKEDIRKVLTQDKNFQHFLTDLLDKRVVDFYDRLERQDYFYVDADIARSNSAKSDLPFFIENSLTTIDSIAEAVVAKLRYKQGDKDA